MNVFEHFLNHELKKNNNEQILFNIYFNSLFPNEKDNYNWKKYIKYKFFILKNYLFQTNTYLKDNLLNVFSVSQKHLNALYKFKHISLMKTKKFLGEQIDLNFNSTELLKNQHTITLLHDNNKVQFSIFDLIRVINSSLSNETQFFSEPKEIKNPRDNNCFSISNLYSAFKCFCDTENTFTTLSFTSVFV